MRKIILLGGGDWHDASYDLLEIPEGMSLVKQKTAWKEWYEKEYVPSLQASIELRIKYISFPEWLVLHGAVRITDVEEIWDD